MKADQKTGFFEGLNGFSQSRQNIIFESFYIHFDKQSLTRKSIFLNKVI